MQSAVIIDRIAEAITQGKLTPLVEDGGFCQITTIADLLRPWEECFPGVAWGDQHNEKRVTVLQPTFTPVPRRSRRRVAIPHPIRPRPFIVSSSLFNSIAAIWDYYLLHDKADKKLLELTCSDKDAQAFIDPLSELLGYFWPLDCCLEDICGNGPLLTQKGIYLRLPSFSYDEEGAGVVEAFISGARGIQGLLEFVDNNEDWDLPKQDLKLIEDAGWGELCSYYYESAGKKVYNLKKLEDPWGSYFGKLQLDYPEQYSEYAQDLFDNGGVEEVLICGPKDIDFCKGYAECFEALLTDLPDYGSFEEVDEMTNFAHEICNVWRRMKGKRLVKWSNGVTGRRQPHG
jgi:hypothetical protein